MKVFISHSSSDKPFVRKLKNDLNLNGIDTWYDEDELLPGDSLMDKLNFALESSSHFMIVLSPISVKSDWVKYELENALKFVEQETLEKIIPILYRPCEIPTPLKNLLHADLSKEIVYLRHGTLEFLDDNYYIKLKILVRSVQQVKSQLQSTDKDEIIGKNSLKYKDTAELIELQYKIIGYKSISNFLANQIPPKIRDAYNKKELSEFDAVVLPRQMEKYLGAYNFGDTVKFIDKLGNEIQGDFARFSTQNNRIVLPRKIRESLSVDRIGMYKVLVDIKNKTIKIEKLIDE